VRWSERLDFEEEDVRGDDRAVRDRVVAVEVVLVSSGSEGGEVYATRR